MSMSKRDLLDRALTGFIYVWAAVAILLNIFAIVGFIIGAPDGWAAWREIRETYSPFNVGNWLSEAVLVSPAIGAYMWREKRRVRAMILEQAQQEATGGQQ